MCQSERTDSQSPSVSGRDGIRHNFPCGFWMEIESVKDAHSQCMTEFSCLNAVGSDNLYCILIQKCRFHSFTQTCVARNSE